MTRESDIFAAVQRILAMYGYGGNPRCMDEQEIGQGGKQEEGQAGSQATGQDTDGEA